MKLTLEQKYFTINKHHWEFISQILLDHKVRGINNQIPVYCDNIEVGFCTRNIAKAIVQDIQS